MSSPAGGFGQNSGGAALAGYFPLIGVLPQVLTQIYTVPSGKNAAIASIEVFNGTLGDVVPIWYLNTDGTDHAFGGATVPGLSGLVDPLPRNLADGSIISAICNVAGVTYIIQLREYTP